MITRQAELRLNRNVFWWNVRVLIAQTLYAAIWIGPWGALFIYIFGAAR